MSEERIERLEKVYRRAKSYWLWHRGYISEGKEIPDDTTDDGYDEEEASRRSFLFDAVRQVDKLPELPS